MEPTNHGVILEGLSEKALLLGSNDRVAHTITLPDRNWLPWYSRGELQIGTYFDTMGCVSFSALKIVEAVLNYLITNNQLSTENTNWLKEKGYIAEDGKVRLADRFTVAMSGTTDKGNTGEKVWWSVRNQGVVPEAMASWDRSRNAPYEQRFEDWYRNPDNLSEEAKELGIEFKDRFTVFYEWTGTSKDQLLYGLIHSPVQVYIPTDCPYVDTIQQACGAGITHAVSVCDDLEPRGYWPLFDHYLKQPQEQGQEQFIRRVTPNYPFYSYGVVCTIAEKNQPMQPDNSFVKVVKDANSSAVGYFLPAHSPAMIEQMAALYGKPVPKKANGEIDWDNFIQGTVTFK